MGGTLPRRKPGTLICWAMVLWALSRLGLSSSKGTSTVSLARVGLKVSTALFTGGSPPHTGSGARRCPGQDRNAGHGAGKPLARRLQPRAPPRRHLTANDRRRTARWRTAAAGALGRGDRTRTCDLLLPKQAR